MDSNIFQPRTVPGSDEIREILVRRVDHQKQAVGIVVGIIDANGRRVVAYGHPANADSRVVDGDTIFEIGSVSKVFTSLLLADMVTRNEVALDDPAAKYLPGDVTAGSEQPPDPGHVKKGLIHTDLLYQIREFE